MIFTKQFITILIFPISSKRAKTKTPTLRMEGFFTEDMYLLLGNMNLKLEKNMFQYWKLQKKSMTK
jgi:hypothetical protein